MKIMIVEDDPTIRGMIQLALTKWSLETVIVENFDLVVQCFIHNQPHLVIMDINLPSYDGFYWCQKIREISNVPVIFLSSRDSPMDVVMSVNMGGDDYIQKPFHMDVLTAKVNALPRRTYSYSDMQSDVLEHEGSCSIRRKVFSRMKGKSGAYQNGGQYTENPHAKREGC